MHFSQELCNPTSLVLPPPRTEHLVRAQGVQRCRGLPCGAGEEIAWRSRGVAYSVVLVEIWYILVECSTRNQFFDLMVTGQL